MNYTKLSPQRQEKLAANRQFLIDLQKNILFLLKKSASSTALEQSTHNLLLLQCEFIHSSIKSTNNAKTFNFLIQILPHVHCSSSASVFHAIVHVSQCTKDTCHADIMESLRKNISIIQAFISKCLTVPLNQTTEKVIESFNELLQLFSLDKNFQFNIDKSINVFIIKKLATVKNYWHLNHIILTEKVALCRLKIVKLMWTIWTNQRDLLLKHYDQLASKREESFKWLESHATMLILEVKKSKKSIEKDSSILVREMGRKFDYSELEKKLFVTSKLPPKTPIDTPQKKLYEGIRRDLNDFVIQDD